MDTSTIKVFSMCVVLELSISECRDSLRYSVDAVEPALINTPPGCCSHSFESLCRPFKSECRDSVHHGVAAVKTGGNRVSTGHSNLVFRIPTLGKK